MTVRTVSSIYPKLRRARGRLFSSTTSFPLDWAAESETDLLPVTFFLVFGCFRREYLLTAGPRRFASF